MYNSVTSISKRPLTSTELKVGGLLKSCVLHIYMHLFFCGIFKRYVHLLRLPCVLRFNSACLETLSCQFFGLARLIKIFSNMAVGSSLLQNGLTGRIIKPFFSLYIIVFQHACFCQLCSIKCYIRIMFTRLFNSSY